MCLALGGVIIRIELDFQCLLGSLALHREHSATVFIMQVYEYGKMAALVRDTAL
jgi:hypothetical protein